ncbi:hypothetical protein BDF19DRAFT_428195 [Syncephalis fuscata]|nr:hypothetical protein BDF19DRAFT_428195 [Syncephalis fuscata]
MEETIYKSKGVNTQTLFHKNQGVNTDNYLSISSDSAKVSELTELNKKLQEEIIGLKIDNEELLNEIRKSLSVNKVVVSHFNYLINVLESMLDSFTIEEIKLKFQEIADVIEKETDRQNSLLELYREINS